MATLTHNCMYCKEYVYSEPMTGEFDDSVDDAVCSSCAAIDEAGDVYDNEEGDDQ